MLVLKWLEVNLIFILFKTLSIKPKITLRYSSNKFDLRTWCTETPFGYRYLVINRKFGGIGIILLLFKNLLVVIP